MRTDEKTNLPRLWHAVIIGAALILCPPANAADGDLDPTFGVGGLVTTDFGNPGDSGRGVAIQSDDKIIVVGSMFSNDTSIDFVVARYNPDGSLDSNFGVGGRVTTNFGGNE